MKTQILKGHGLIAMLINIVAATIPVILLAMALLYKQQIGYTSLITAITLCLVFMFPHPTYLFFEIKHIICKDGIADEKDIEAIAVFGLQSALGFVLQIQAIVLAYRVYDLKQYGFACIIALAALAAFGGCLGLTNLVWIQGLYPPKLLKHCRMVLKSKTLRLVFIATTLMLTAVSYFFC